jgi:hypothetical protein
MKKNGLGFGLFLIAAGILWLLNMLDVFKIPVSESFSRLWPLLLVAIGLSMIFSHKQILKIAIWFVFLAVIICYSIFGPFGWKDGGNDRGTGSQEYSWNSDLDAAAEKGVMDIDIGGATLDIGATDQKLFTAEIFDRDMAYDVSGTKTADVKIYSTVKNRSAVGNDQFSWDLGLSDRIPWEIVIDAGAIKGELDLSGVEVSKLDVNIGASSMNILLSDKAELVEVTIKAGVSSINFEVPDGTGVRIRLQGALISRNFTGAGLVKDGDYYYSDKYDGAAKKVDIYIEMGVGNIELKYR